MISYLQDCVHGSDPRMCFIIGCPPKERVVTVSKEKLIELEAKLAVAYRALHDITEVRYSESHEKEWNELNRRTWEIATQALKTIRGGDEQ